MTDLTLGFVGNRDLSAVDVDALRDDLKTVFTRLCLGAETLLITHQAPRFILINSLAPMVF